MRVGPFSIRDDPPRSPRHAARNAGLVKHEHILLRPDPSRTVIRPFAPDYPDGFESGQSRVQQIAERVMELGAEDLDIELTRVKASLDERHRDVDDLLRRRFCEVAASLMIDRTVADDQQRLIGAYLSEEYAFEAAALFNPSVVLDPGQAPEALGTVRFIMSLRGIGEGHISSVTFRTGLWLASGEVVVDTPSETAIPPVIQLPEGADDSVTLCCDGSRDVSETVLFPVLARHRQGIEDLRLVRFSEDDGSTLYHGIFTAFDGAQARPELLTTGDFRSFEMRPLSGAAARAKGMALFPRRVGGRFAMLGRQDSESIWVHQSDRLLNWEGGGKVLQPRYPWEFVQLGNCGSPIEIEEGWLVITHGVGAVRNYCIGACLLDRSDPTKLLARTERPVLEPSVSERDGYVPNVVYSCGSLVRDRMLLLPFGVADNFATVATVSIDSLLASMG